MFPAPGVHLIPQERTLLVLDGTNFFVFTCSPEKMGSDSAFHWGHCALVPWLFVCKCQQENGSDSASIPSVHRGNLSTEKDFLLPCVQNFFVSMHMQMENI